MATTSVRRSSTAGALLLAVILILGMPSRAGDTGAFVGGMLAGRVMHNMHERTQAEKAQAYYAQQSYQQQQSQPVQQAQPAAPSTQTTEQKLEQLDKLAAGGYITPEEYKAKRQAIIDAM